MDKTTVKKIKFEIELDFGKQEQEEFGDVESFIQEMIDQLNCDFNDVDMWTVEE